VVTVWVGFENETRGLTTAAAALAVNN